MIIRLEDIEFHANHGVYPDERQNGNTFLVTVTLSLPRVCAIETDQLADTINYQQVYELVANEMDRPSNLLEHVAGRIQTVLKASWPQADVTVQIKKKKPPVGGQVAWATIEI